MVRRTDSELGTRKNKKQSGVNVRRRQQPGAVSQSRQRAGRGFYVGSISTVLQIATSLCFLRRLRTAAFDLKNLKASIESSLRTSSGSRLIIRPADAPASRCQPVSYAIDTVLYNI